MTQNAPAFWARYRGTVDPQQPFNTVYTYGMYCYLSTPPYQFPNGSEFFTETFSVLGPPQLTKQNFIEIRWNYFPGLTVVRITRQPIPGGQNLWYSSNGAEQGFRDEGQFNVINGGVTNQ